MGEVSVSALSVAAAEKRKKHGYSKNTPRKLMPRGINCLDRNFHSKEGNFPSFTELLHEESEKNIPRDKNIFSLSKNFL